jgi:MFS transporter, ACS family, tartrate transporter
MDKQLLRKLNLRIVGFTIVLFLVNYIDRVNIGFAALQMNQDLGFSAAVYGFGAGVFYLGYVLFEIPSNLILARVGARVWIARIMISWGVLSGAMAFVHSATAFYIVRFLIGASEAGLIPGVLYYLGNWFPAKERARPMALFFSAGPLAIVLGAPLSGYLLSALDGLGGVRGWHWMFVAEAVPSILLGIYTFFSMADRPRDARWLTPAESSRLEAMLEAERAAVTRERHYTVLEVFREPRILLLALLYFCLITGNNGIVYWLPQIINGMGTMSRVEVGFLTALPYVVTFIGVRFIARSSDRSGERKLHIAACALVAALSLAASAYLPPAAALACICLASLGIWGSYGPFWTLPSSMLTGAAAAGGLAFINSFAQIGGFVGPFAVGWIKEETHSFSAALLVLAGFELLAMILVLSMTHRRSSLAPVPEKA